MGDGDGSGREGGGMVFCGKRMWILKNKSSALRFHPGKRAPSHICIRDFKKNKEERREIMGF